MAISHVVAIAARTPVGLAAESTAAAVRAELSRIAEHPFFVDAAGEPVLCGRDDALDPTMMGAERFVALARPCLRALAGPLAGAVARGRRLVLHLALPEPRPGFDQADARAVVEALASETLPGLGQLDVRAVGTGHAGAFQGVDGALKILRQGNEELCLVGGVDSYLDGATLDWLEENRRLACSDARGGFPPGEGAAFVALSGDSLRRHLRLPSLAVVRGVSCTFERRDPASLESVQGEALAQAFDGMGAHLRQPAEKFDDAYCDVNGERVRNHDLSFALLRAGGLFRDGTAYRTAVGSIGDLGAASVPLNCALAVRAWARRYASGPTALVFGSSWAGARGALLLQQPQG